MLYHYIEPDNNHPKEENVTIILKNILKKCIRYEMTSITDETGSPYEWWMKIGSPDFINADQLNFLVQKSKMQHDASVAFCDSEQEDFTIEIPLKPSDVKLIEIRIN